VKNEDEPLRALLVYAKNNSEFFQVDHLSRFYIKNDIVGLSFEGNKYTHAFEYHLKTKKIK